MKNPQRTPCLVTVDPGVQGTGLVAWEHGLPIAAKAVVPKGHGPWLERAQQVVTSFRAFLLCIPARVAVAIEDQSIWEGSAVARTAALRGDIIRLAQLTGMLMQVALQQGATVRLVGVREWKGQLPKAAVHSRIKRILGQRYPEHVADAVGMGLYLRGLL